MRTFRYDKLVRDKIVFEMIKEGSKVIWRTLDDEEYAREIIKKLEEELDELEDGVGKDRARDLSKLADIAELYETAWDVVDRDEYYDELEAAMEELDKGIDMWEIDPDELLAAKAAKIDRMGAFKAKYFVETVSVTEDNPRLQRYLKNPEKYPEII